LGLYLCRTYQLCLPILDPAKLLDYLAPRAGRPELYTINTLERQTCASVAIDVQRLLPAVANRGPAGAKRQANPVNDVSLMKARKFSALFWRVTGQGIAAGPPGNAWDRPVANSKLANHD
jgi:hypothetical protein